MSEVCNADETTEMVAGGRLNYASKGAFSFPHEISSNDRNVGQLFVDESQNI